MHEGSCQCGSVRFTLDGPFVLMLCHCRICQKIHGSAFAPFLHAEARHFDWVGGESELRFFDTSEHLRRAFCARCGAPMPILDRELNHVAIPASASDMPVNTRPAAHLHTASQAPWFVIGDNAPRYATVPDGSVAALLMQMIGGQQ